MRWIIPAKQVSNGLASLFGAKIFFFTGINAII